MRLPGCVPLLVPGTLLRPGTLMAVALIFPAIAPLSAQERTGAPAAQERVQVRAESEGMGASAETTGLHPRQTRPGPLLPEAWFEAPEPALAGGVARFSGSEASMDSPWLAERAVLASAVLPGAGQWMFGQRRWAAYLLVEGVGWFEYTRRRNDGRDLRREYRTLAWEVAREPITEGQRVDGWFEYYETLTRFPASGAFDLEPGEPGIRPETDASTYNGAIWALARGLFLPPDVEEPDVASPEYALALQYYLDRSYPPELGWDWRGQEEQQVRFSGLIRDSDEAFRRSTTMLGVVIGNRVLSSIDALVSARARRVAGADARLELRLVPLQNGFERPRSAVGWSDPWSGDQPLPVALQATFFH